ncbi:type II toxin-antitoxin system RelE/ParE family toxin [Providencia rettgeri]
MAHCYSIRVNSQYRLIFIWENGIKNLYLDPHKDI